MTRAIEPDDAERIALEQVLHNIEAAGLAVADEHAAQVRVEKARGGRFPYVTFRAYGFLEPEEEALNQSAAPQSDSGDCLD